MAEVKRSLLVGAPRILYHLSICTSTQQMIVLGLWMRGWPTTVYAFFCVLPFFLFATSIDKVVSLIHIHFVGATILHSVNAICRITFPVFPTSVRPKPGNFFDSAFPGGSYRTWPDGCGAPLHELAP